MRIAFVSTLLWYPWGGSEALWTAAADAAVARRHRAPGVSDLVEPHARIRALRRAGATVVTRVSGARALALNQRVRRRLRQRLHLTDAHARAVAAFRPDLVVVSGGGPYDLMFELIWWPGCAAAAPAIGTSPIFSSRIPRWAPSNSRNCGGSIPAAERLFFVSERNLATTRRHLIDPLPNAVVINGCAVFNPVLPSAGSRCPGRMSRPGTWRWWVGSKRSRASSCSCTRRRRPWEARTAGISACTGRGRSARNSRRAPPPSG